MLIVIAAHVLAVALNQVEKPELLLLAERARSPFTTAKIEFSVRSGPGDLSAPYVFFSQFSGDSQFTVRKGLRDGCQYTNEADAVGTQFAFSERRQLNGSDGRQWQYVEGNFSANCTYDSGSSFFPSYDVRTLGLNPEPRIDVGPGDYLSGENISRFEVLDDPKAPKVKAFGKNGVEACWELEPAFDYQPVRVTIGRDGVTSREVISEYDVFDNRWFPKRVTYYTPNGAVLMEFEVLRAEFDRADHEKELTPAILDMPIGAQIYFPPGPEPSPQVWTGNDLITLAETKDRYEKGTLDLSVVIAMQKAAEAGACVGCYPKSMEGEWFGLFGAPRKPKLWEEYVRRFIQVFALDKEQSGKAWDSHKHWYEKAKPRLDAMESTLKEIDKKLADLRDPNKTPLKDADPAKETANLEERKNKLLKPIEAMFQEGLRPDLFKLPTQEQKAVVLKREDDKKGSSGLIELLRKP